jgi:hypothetical protein
MATRAAIAAILFFLAISAPDDRPGADRGFHGDERAGC